MQKIFTWLKNKTHQQQLFAIFLLATSVLGVGILVRSGLRSSFQPEKNNQITVVRPQSVPTNSIGENSQSASVQPANNQVLGDETGSLFISAANADFYLALGSQSTQEAPLFHLDSRGSFQGEVKIKVFKVNEEFLTDFLMHDEKNDLLNTEFNFDEQQLVGEFTENVALKDSKEIELPVEVSGLWYIKVEGQGVADELLLIRSNLGASIHEGKDKAIVWVQDFRNYQSVADAEVEFINYEQLRSSLSKNKTNGQGIAEMPLATKADLALIRKDGELSILPINLQHVNYGYAWKIFSPQKISTKNFVFTDRPLYKPGDTVYFKAFFRNDDDARYTIPSGAVKVSLYDTWAYDEAKPIQVYTLSLSDHGGVDGQFTLPADDDISYYYLALEYAGQKEVKRLSVQEYRKPEYTLDVDAPQNEYIAGDPLYFTAIGQYFFGEPLANKVVDYKVFINDYHNWTYYQPLDVDQNFYAWGNAYNRDELTSGEVTLDQAGQAQINVTTALDDFHYDKVFIVEVSFRDETTNRVQSVKNVLVHAGEFNVYRQSNSYHMTRVGETAKQLFELKAHETGEIEQRPIRAKLTRIYWEEVDDPDHNYKFGKYERREEELDTFTTQSDENGQFEFSFTPQKKGLYEWEVTAEDERSNTVIKTFHQYIYQEGQPVYSPDNHSGKLTIKADQDSYLPTETVQFQIYSSLENSDVLLTFERGYVHRYQVVRLAGRSKQVDVQLEDWDMPNIFAQVASFQGNDFNRDVETVIVKPDKQTLKVTVETDKERYQPGDEIELTVKTTNLQNKPTEAELAVWAVDKAMYELAPDNVGDIFNTYWRERYNNTHSNHSLAGIMGPTGAEMGGCFAAGTQVLMADGQTQDIELVKVGDQILTLMSETSDQLIAASVLDIHQARVSGYLIINGDLKVTPNHKIFINGAFHRADTAQIGDRLMDQEGRGVEITSLEWLRGNFTVYNLMTDFYHTYIANNLYVHNDKGGVRDVFADTAYWNPRVKTDGNGEARLKFVLPDNLTTWVVSALGMTVDTKAGQQTKEIIVSKEIQIRPVMPNLLRLGDQARLSALVHNFTEDSHEFEVSLTAEDLKIKNEQQTVKLEPNGLTQLFWDVEPKNVSASAPLTFKLQAQDNEELVDEMVQQLPIETVGFKDVSGEFKDGPGEFKLNLDPQANLDRSTISLSLTPSLLGNADSGVSYLLGYPYGCAEQNSSRMAMILLAQVQPNLFCASACNLDLPAMMSQGIKNLQKLQNSNGGWPWWKGKSEVFVTTHVTSILATIQQQQPSDKVAEMLDSAKNYFINLEPLSYEERVAQYYGLSMVDPIEAANQMDVTDWADFEEPDLLALIILAEANLGQPDEQKVNQLMTLSLAQGENLSWAAGPKGRFGSTQASTGLAIQALLAAGVDVDQVTPAVRYLVHHKSHYWANTYGTMQSVQALAKFVQVGHELTPNYDYTVKLGDRVIKAGHIGDYQTVIDIKAPVNEVRAGAETLTVTKSGQGKLYSTLIVDQYIEDNQADAVSNGIEITREYLSDKGPEYNLAVGDEVTIKLTVSGLSSEERYGVIRDYLPAGMVPINLSLMNEASLKVDKSSGYYRGYQETTHDGMIISLPNVGAGTKEYSYRARVVNAGTYYAPSASISLMYSPEIYARTRVDQVKLEVESKQVRSITDVVRDITAGQPFLLPLTIGLVIMLGTIGTMVFLTIKKRKASSQSITPTPEQVTPTVNIQPEPTVQDENKPIQPPTNQ